MTIRPARYEDVDGVAKTVIAAWRFAYSGFLPAEFMDKSCDQDQRAARMRETWSDKPLYLVAVDERNEVIGFAKESVPPYEGFDAEIGALYVHPSAARAGIGQALVREMATEFRLRGHKSLAIHTLSQNEIGCGFYIKLGGRKHKETEWHGFPSVWFVWDDLMSLLKDPVRPKIRQNQ